MKKLFIILSIISAILLTKQDACAQVITSVQIVVAPPEIPYYIQPECPYDGYLWSPGYWAYSSGDYYWVPGVWVSPPQRGYLWTPGYWAYTDGYYGWNGGYWGEHVGYYGGVCYGYGYGGSGYYGGRWEGQTFQYNTTVSHVNTAVVHNTYVSHEGENNSGNRSSYNGKGGVTAQPTANEQVAMKENHAAATSDQRAHQQSAGNDKKQYAAINHGKPEVAAVKSVSSAHTNPTPASNNTHSAAPTPAHQTPAANNTHSAAPANTHAAPIRDQARPAGNTQAPAHTAPANRQPAPVREQPRPQVYKNVSPANNQQRPAGNVPANQQSAPVREQPRPQMYQQRQSPAGNQQRPDGNVPANQHPAPMNNQPRPENNAPRNNAPPEQHNAPNQGPPGGSHPEGGRQSEPHQEGRPH